MDTGVVIKGVVNNLGLSVDVLVVMPANGGKGVDDEPITCDVYVTGLFVEVARKDICPVVVGATEFSFTTSFFGFVDDVDTSVVVTEGAINLFVVVCPTVTLVNPELVVVVVNIVECVTLVVVLGVSATVVVVLKSGLNVVGAMVVTTDCLLGLVDDLISCNVLVEVKVGLVIAVVVIVFPPCDVDWAGVEGDCV